MLCLITVLLTTVIFFSYFPQTLASQSDCHLCIREANAPLPTCRCTYEINLTMNCRVLKHSPHSAVTAVTLALATVVSQSSAAGTRPLCVSCSAPYEESRRKERTERLQPTDKAHVGKTGTSFVSTANVLFTCAAWDTSPMTSINKAIKSVSSTLKLSVQLQEIFNPECL